ncbi:peptide-methionine (S)-S-oxide reductase MsrA [Wenzhouxiangella sp. XN79A]|uniref:peptide-methionine (S)-S-oxide reductase MsrA n=1 Tax=Wenzhouxiangella sp. XN79A TaxID=2724193 RepID=UPI00144AEA14|nr:peptide-methionine (S)-S-oxide reductase MsrA [Wenzhouxiangella sp. XN79A]NKI34313.1 peptide-methionine (S)-S-oxide reductase MsrA [Wenzhouxiangella sp. XN79A]
MTPSTTRVPARPTAPRVNASALLLVAVAAVLVAATARAEERVATFGGGCFWCMEPPYDDIDGVISTTSGYMGGTVDHPSYEQVVRGGTGHVEVVQVRYDDERVSYEELLYVFWRNIDPLTDNRQFCDAGESYRPVIFAHDAGQRVAAEISRRELVDSGRFEQPIVVPIETAGTFWPAEDYHQDYYRKNSVRYKYYRWRCGRDERLEALWGDEAGG